MVESLQVAVICCCSPGGQSLISMPTLYSTPDESWTMKRRLLKFFTISSEFSQTCSSRICTSELLVSSAPPHCGRISNEIVPAELLTLPPAGKLSWASSVNSTSPPWLTSPSEESAPPPLASASTSPLNGIDSNMSSPPGDLGWST